MAHRGQVVPCYQHRKPLTGPLSALYRGTWGLGGTEGAGLAGVAEKAVVFGQQVRANAIEGRPFDRDTPRAGDRSVVAGDLSAETLGED